MKTKEPKLLKDFGKFIVDTRKGLNLPQKELVNLLNKHGYQCTQSMMAQIEAGKISNPNRNFLFALSQSLKVEFDVVMLEFVADKYEWTPKTAGQKDQLPKFEPESLIFFIKYK